MASLYVLVYSFAMKYVAILAVVLVIMRIDFILGLFEKISENSAPAVEVDSSEISSSREIIPVTDDVTLKQTPKTTFLALLEDFHIRPSEDLRQRAMTIFKSHPTMFTQKLDRELESEVFRWRDLLNNNDPETVSFLLDLMGVLQGENLEMLKRFFSLWMEIDMGNFVAAYSKTKDVNCLIATTFGDVIPEEEKLNEYVERENALKALLAQEKSDAAQKAFISKCLLVLGLQINKMSPALTPGDAPSPAAQEGIP